MYPELMAAHKDPKVAEMLRIMQPGFDGTDVNI
jgi:hypothetical protein